MTINLEILGQRLKNARVNCDLTQEEVANQLGLPRPAIVQIEAGNRSVSTLELVQMAKLYHQDISLLLSEDIKKEEDVLVTLFRAGSSFEKKPQFKNQIARYLDIFREGMELERLIGEKRTLPPAYELPDPQNYGEAFEQGKEIAIQERKRLNLGHGPLANVAEILSSQGIWVVTGKFPEDLSGLFIHAPSIGMAIVINGDHSRGRRRFSYAHEYAHALLDRKKGAAIVTSQQNSNELIEKRANAFASEFLIPSLGVQETLERLNKGGSSRKSMWLYNETTQAEEHAEIRHEPDSQKISYQDVAYLAHEFLVSYDAAVYKLSALGLLNRQELHQLLDKKTDGKALIRFLKFEDLDEKSKDQESPQLAGEIGRIAIEALRREKISGGRFLDICDKLEIEEGESLLELARKA